MPDRTLNDRGCLTIAEHGDYLVEIIPMGFNHRLVLTPKAMVQVYDHGWCYPDLRTAYIAALVWDPDTDDEPPGFIKRATFRRREAPNREPGAPYRCEHGHWAEHDYCTRPALADPAADR